MCENSHIIAGIAMTTTHAPSRNFENSSTSTAIAVITDPVALIATRSRQRGGRSLRQWRTRPTWLSVKPMNTPIANSGIRLLTRALDATSSTSDSERQRPDPDPVHRPLSAQIKDVRQPVILGQQAHQHRQPAEACVGRQAEHQRDRDVGDVERPPGAKRGRRHLGQHGHAAAWLDVMRVNQQRDADQHHAEQDPEQDLGPLRGAGSRLAERRRAVGDRLDAGDG